VTAVPEHSSVGDGLGAVGEGLGAVGAGVGVDGVAIGPMHVSIKHSFVLVSNTDTSSSVSFGPFRDA